jgi:hypothetical protein
MPKLRSKPLMPKLPLLLTQLKLPLSMPKSRKLSPSWLRICNPMLLPSKNASKTSLTKSTLLRSERFVSTQPPMISKLSSKRLSNNISVKVTKTMPNLRKCSTSSKSSKVTIMLYKVCSKIKMVLSLNRTKKKL